MYWSDRTLQLLDVVHAHACGLEKEAQMLVFCKPSQSLVPRIPLRNLFEHDERDHGVRRQFDERRCEAFPQREHAFVSYRLRSAV